MQRERVWQGREKKKKHEWVNNTESQRNEIETDLAKLVNKKLGSWQYEPVFSSSVLGVFGRLMMTISSFSTS